MTRRPAFWAAYAALSVVALVFAWRLFPLAIPLVNLDLRLSRQEAIASAEATAARLQLVPDGARSAARFASDAGLQNYVELEGGGKPAFAAIVAGDAYSPWWWEVRLFTPGGVNEAVLRYRPDGAGNGFSQRLPEAFLPADPARRALDAEAAKALAETRAKADWGVDFAPWSLLERTQQKATNGRLDHTIVYERAQGNIGASRFRLRLTVTGDVLTEVSYYAHVPESFDRRFQELRSANNTLAGAASLAGGLLYGLGGCILGVLWLLRQHQLLWRPALAAGLVVGGLLGATSLASAPLAWFGFDSAQSVDTFWIRQVGNALLAAAGGGVGYALVFMAGESLSRRAFGGHPQLWRAWSREAAPTRQLLGRTLGGYLFVPIELALIAAFYYATNRWLGWWQPSEALTDPNILGSAIPALAPIAMSLQAGFMEECLFRAVPLSLAAIIGERYGFRRAALGVALVLQAAIFGAAHANYPGFPAYARLVELIGPALVWGLIFLRFGLVPTIILHATFDLVLFAIPVFLIDAPGGALQRVLVVAAGLVPLGVVLARRVAAGGWGELAPASYNRAWRPPAPVADAPAPGLRRSAGVARGWPAAFLRVLPLLGAAGLVAWGLAARFNADVPPLPQPRAAAIAAADAALGARGVALAGDWRRAAMPKLAVNEPAQRPWHKFVWQEAGPAAYSKQVGGTLAPPLWEVRYARFDGPVDERAEEWRVTINGDGTVRGVHHALPEGRAGARLDRDAALALAEREVRDRFAQDPAALTAVGADEQRLPARTDWAFIFGDPGADVGAGGEARILVGIAGDGVASSGRFVHVPETWLRAQRERDGRMTIVKLALGAVVAAGLLAALIMAVLRWTQGCSDRRLQVIVSGVAFAVSAADIANQWPGIAMGLSTAEPVLSQVGIAVGGALLAGLVAALLYGLAAGVGVWSAQHQPVHPLAGRLPAWAAGIAGACLVTGLGAVFQRFAPQLAPLWPSYAAEGSWFPPLAAVTDGMQALMICGVALYALSWLARLTHEFTRQRWVAVVLLVLLFAGSALLGGRDPVVALAAGVAEGLLTATVVYALFRHDDTAVPAYVATGTVLHFLQAAALKSTPAAWLDAAIAVAITIAVTMLLTRYLLRTRAAAAVAGPASQPAT